MNTLGSLIKYINPTTATTRKLSVLKFKENAKQVIKNKRLIGFLSLRYISEERIAKLVKKTVDGSVAQVLNH